VAATTGRTLFKRDGVDYLAVKSLDAPTSADALVAELRPTGFE
jgi:hypothetical protein